MLSEYQEHNSALSHQVDSLSKDTLVLEVSAEPQEAEDNPARPMPNIILRGNDQ